jgi:peptidoglycan hydrolase-like protein with peptidoglycan-binding domain
MHRNALVALLAGTATLFPLAAQAAIDTDLVLGSRGPQVAELQGFLKQQGLFSAATSTRFGPLTKSAVIAFQKREGISPASGRVGRTTRSKIVAILATTTKVSTTASNFGTTSTTPPKSATSTGIREGTVTPISTSGKSPTTISTTTPFLDRLTYIARKDFQDNLNLAILLRLQAIFDQQQDVLRSFQSICTASCYSQLTSADNSLSNTIAEVRNAVSNERYAIATLGSYRERLISAYTHNDLSASTSTARFSAAATERATPLGRINDDAGSYEKLVFKHARWL